MAVSRRQSEVLDRFSGHTSDRERSILRFLEADAKHKDALVELIGTTDFDARRASLQSQLLSVREELLRRELFCATAD